MKMKNARICKIQNIIFLLVVVGQLSDPRGSWRFLPLCHSLSWFLWVGFGLLKIEPKPEVSLAHEWLDPVGEPPNADGHCQLASEPAPFPPNGQRQDVPPTRCTGQKRGWSNGRETHLTHPHLGWLRWRSRCGPVGSLRGASRHRLVARKCP